ncbi:YcnI family copper-binding membrane protein [Lentzea sp. NPDC054927]
MSSTRLARAGACAAAALAAALASAGSAWAHVSPTPGEISRTGSSEVAFRVPTESTTAGTVKFELTLPAENPVSSVRLEPKAGWNGTITRAKLDKPVTTNGITIEEAVRNVTWTAEPGVRIAPDQYGVFRIYLAGLPSTTDTLVVAAAQTYDDGKVANWDQPPKSDGTEPENPAPVIKLVAGGSDMAGMNHGTTSQTATSQDNSARYLAGGALALAALGLGIGVGALLRVRRATQEQS